MAAATVSIVLAFAFVVLNKNSTRSLFSALFPTLSTSTAYYELCRIVFKQTTTSLVYIPKPVADNDDQDKMIPALFGEAQ